MSKTYTIGDRRYRMDELVLDQEEALADLLLEPLYGGTETTATALVDALLRKKLLKKALAIVLKPEGVEIESIDREAVERDLGKSLTLSRQAEVVRDFFEVNAGAIEQLKGLGPELKKAGSTS
jgi:hypothetical protein